MKNLTKNTMIAAAALVVAAGVVQAQSIKVEVPFSFRAAGALMPAGEYWVGPMGSGRGIPIFQLSNVDANRSIMAMPYVTENRASGSYEASLTFQCASSQCALVKLANGSGQTYRFASPGIGRDENSRVAVIRAVLVKGR